MDTILWQPNFYALALMAAGILSVSGTAIASQRRGNPGAVWLAWLMAAITVWSFGYALELAIGDLRIQILMAKIEYFGITTTPVLWFFFALSYCGYNDILRRGRLHWLWLGSLSFLLLAWTNEMHGLIWTGFHQVHLNALKILVVTHGLAFWGLVAFSYILLLGGSVLFIRQAAKTRSPHRAQSLLILLAVALIWAGNVLYNSGLNPFPYLDLTSFAMTAAGLIAVFSLLRIGPLDLFPVVSEAVLDSMNDGILVLDEKDELLYANRTFRQYAGIPASLEDGMSFEKIFAHWPGFFETFHKAASANTEFMVAPEPTQVSYFALRIAPLPRRKNAAGGRVLIFEDISEHKQAEIQLAVQQLSRSAAHPPENLPPLAFTFRAKDGKIIEVNRTFILRLGYPREDIVGRTLLEAGVWNAEQRADFLRQVHQTGEVKGYSVRFARRDGEFLEVKLSAARLQVGEEAFIFCLASVP
ncbi:MAG: histidine kinase N-terminal 7TM domain-containing protein [Anaerolineales bacterium]